MDSAESPYANQDDKIQGTESKALEENTKVNLELKFQQSNQEELSGPKPKQFHPKLETFVMTRDILIQLNPHSSNHSQLFLRNNSSSTYGHCSTPASPEESEHRTRNKVRNSPLFHSPVSDKKNAFWETSSAANSSGFVRSSKSEDHLQKSSLSTVSIDIEEDMASSLNTLLDTKHDPSSWISLSQVPTSPSSPPPISPKSEEEDDSSSSSSGSPAKTASHHPPLPPAPPTTAAPIAHSTTTSSDSPTIIKDSVLIEYSEEADSTSDLVSTISSSEEAENLPDSELNSPLGALDGHEECSLIVPDFKEFYCDRQFNNHESNTTTATWCGPPQPSSQNCCLPSQPIKIVNILGDCANSIAERPKSQDISAPTTNHSIIISPFENNFEWPALGYKSPGSPNSAESESTIGDVPYEELVESHDEDDGGSSVRSASPPTDDDSDIESLHSFHYSPKAVDMPSASRLAKRLYNLEGFKKTDVSRHLSKNNDFSRVVAEEYLKYFDFTGDSLDLALRKFLRQFCLIGETQERERVLVHFSKRFVDCNPGCFRSQDAAHTLTCAIMLLNTDLHGENVMRKMTCGEFIENLADLNDGENFPRDVLKSLYQAIKTQPLDWAINEEEKKSDPEAQPPSDTKTNTSIGHNPFLEVPNPNCATEYKKGYVMRKCCIEPNGKRTPIGKRGWKMLYATLRDLVLYLHKDEHGFKKNQLYDSLHNSIRIHHAVAVKATDYTKKQFVFRLHTADQSEYLFQTSDSKELQNWIDTMNTVAASLSSPPLASAVGSTKKFQRPLLPVSHTRFNLREQLQDHENRILWLEKELEEHLGQTPEKLSKSRFLQEFTEKDHYLQFELMRYKTYVYLLRTKMAQYPELELSLVETPIGEVDEPGERSTGGLIIFSKRPPSSKSHHRVSAAARHKHS